MENKKKDTFVTGEVSDDQLEQVAGGLISAADEEKWKRSFPSGCTVRAKYRSCAICLAYFGTENREFRLVWGSYRTGFGVTCTKCSTPLKDSQNTTEWECNPAAAFIKC